MANVLVRPYASPTMVLLAFDWPDGPRHPDFLGFAIRRAPGHGPTGASDFLYNKIAFHPLKRGEPPHPSDTAPLQKFHWWDGGIHSADRGKTFTYTVYPVRGTGEHALRLVETAATSVDVTIPSEEADGVGTYFNRAVVSSQAFLAYRTEVGGDLDRLMAWLANGLQDAIPRFLAGATHVVGAIYHLTDKEWVVPALQHMTGDLSMVYHLHDKAGAKNQDTSDQPAVQLLTSSTRTFHPRRKTAIMHDKFLVRDPGTDRAAVLTGSANFTPEALTVQANLLHTFRSRAMAALYAARHDLLEDDPAKKDTAGAARWESVHDVPGARIRVFFSPEPGAKRDSIDAVVQAVRTARKSVLFCMFAPTDPELLTALLAAGDRKKMMYGLLNSIEDPTKPKRQRVLAPEKATLEAKARYRVKTEIFHRSKDQRDVVAFDYFHEGHAPRGFLPELSTIDTGSKSLRPPSTKIPTVHVHHKFIVIDGETTHPTIYTGSANMSNASVHDNDENLLDITGSPKLAQIYVAEFLRLYDHYRTRALWESEHGKRKGAKGPKPKGKKGAGTSGFVLKTTRDGWIRDAYTPDSLDYIARTRLMAPPA